MRRTDDVHLGSGLLCILLLVFQAVAEVPFTPTSLLYSSQHNGSFAYLLRPSGGSLGRIQFLSLNVSGAIDTSNPSYTVLLEDAPFHPDVESSAYLPVIDQYGVVRVYTGDCQELGNKSMLWQFTPDSSSSIGNGTWEQFPVRGAEGQSDSVTFGPNYLSAGFAYSPSNTTAGSFYAFAGMCPLSSDSSASWVATANYSQSMVVLDPLTSNKTNTYRASITGDRAPPIPEAGLTITPLPATYGYSDDEMRQQQDFLLIGGHTQRAFLNMSELAVFSTPQNSWSFVTVGTVDETQQTELAIRDLSAIEPRSGHTAVLSPDGSKVIVFGGWVGNTSVPATPQVAILEIGGGYIGSGEWTWKIPSTRDAGIPKGTGIYGHGAMLLPGGVMMIAGGYRISQSTKRSLNEPQPNSKVYLYNLTSGSWASSYENPFASLYEDPEGIVDTPSSSSPESSSLSTKAALGFGLGLGIPAVAGVAVFGFFFCRRHKVRRSRNKELRKLALGAERPHFWGRDEECTASSIRKPEMKKAEPSSDYPWNHNSNAGRRPNWNDNGDAAAERTGLLGGSPSPTKPSRPPLNARMYRPPIPFHDHNRSDTTGDIHPIDEREEDEAHGVETIEKRDTVEPLISSPLLSRQEPCVEEQCPADAISLETTELAGGTGLDGDGSFSQDKSERTSSNLSDSSTSSKSIKSSHFSRGSLPPSGRHSPNKSITYGRDGVRSRDSAVTSLSHEKRYSSDSFSTAHTTLSQRHAEGEHLLQPDGPEPSSLSSTFLDLFPKPTNQASSRPRASEWIGNVRRVLSVTRRRPSAADHITDANNPTCSLASGIDGGRNTVIGIPGLGITRIPQRSVSASAELFRRKQGAKDWGADPRSSRDTTTAAGFHSARSTRDDFGLSGLMDLDSDDDWDVEGAAEGRRVQVTFTVPKEKLRVVNATADDMDNYSEKSISRSNSAS